MLIYSPKTPVLDRLLDRVELHENGCWIWTGSVTGRGYGHIYGGPGKPMRTTHRVTYEHFIGAVPDGLVLDHLCREQLCANPWHLEAVDQRTNVLRGSVVKTRCPRGHLKDGWTKSKCGHRIRYCKRCKRERQADLRGRADR